MAYSSRAGDRQPSSRQPYPANDEDPLGSFPSREEKAALAARAALARFSHPPPPPALVSSIGSNTAAATASVATASGVGVDLVPADNSCSICHKRIIKASVLLHIKSGEVGNAVKDCEDVKCARKKMVQLLHTKLLDPHHTAPTVALDCVTLLRTVFQNALTAAAEAPNEVRQQSSDPHTANVAKEQEHSKYLKLRADKDGKLSRNVLNIDNANTGEALFVAAGWRVRVIDMQKHLVFDPWATHKNNTCVSCGWAVAMEVLRVCEHQLAKVEPGARDRAVEGSNKEHQKRLEMEHRREQIRKQLEQDAADRRNKFTYG